MTDSSASKFFDLIYRIYSWLLVIPILGLVTFLVTVFIIIMSTLGYPDLSSRIFGTIWARVNLACMLSGISVTGREKIDRNQSYIVVANHQSLIDIYALYGYLGMDIKWVMKKELRKIPMLGKACEVMGHIIVDRSNTKAALDSINSARESIIKGNSVIFFAEGTRSRNGDLLPFKKGAFRLAKDLELPILPVVIEGTKDILPSDTMRFRPGHINMHILDPLPQDLVKSSDINSLSAKTRSLIEAQLEKRNAG